MTPQSAQVLSQTILGLATILALYAGWRELFRYLTVRLQWRGVELVPGTGITRKAAEEPVA